VTLTEPQYATLGPGPLKGRPSRCPNTYRYYLFARSEVNKAAGPAYNGVTNILVDGEHVQAMTYETVSPEGSVPDWALYDFSEDFVPRSVSFSDHYWEDHRKLTAEGKIKHSLDACPERLTGLTVRAWSPQDGWKDVTLPPIASNGGR
jgi:hypothetical protein